MFCLDKHYIDEMVAHARQERPNECCGALIGRNGRVIKLIRATNAEHSPIRYSIEPNELIKIYQEITEKELELLAIYHSHPQKEAYPSEIDVDYASFPQSIYIIISLINFAQPVIKAFNIINGEITEQELEVLGSSLSDSIGR